MQTNGAVRPIVRKKAALCLLRLLRKAGPESDMLAPDVWSAKLVCAPQIWFSPLFECVSCIYIPHLLLSPPTCAGCSVWCSISSQFKRLSCLHDSCLTRHSTTVHLWYKAATCCMFVTEQHVGRAGSRSSYGSRHTAAWYCVQKL